MPLIPPVVHGAFITAIGTCGEKKDGECNSKELYCVSECHFLIGKKQAYTLLSGVYACKYTEFNVCLKLNVSF